MIGRQDCVWLLDACFLLLGQATKLRRVDMGSCCMRQGQHGSRQEVRASSTEWCNAPEAAACLSAGAAASVSCGSGCCGCLCSFVLLPCCCCGVSCASPSRRAGYVNCCMSCIWQARPTPKLNKTFCPVRRCLRPHSLLQCQATLYSCLDGSSCCSARTLWLDRQAAGLPRAPPVA